jgi:hypothetical protein
LQVGALQVGTSQVGVSQVGTSQVGVLQVGALQVGVSQVGVLQVGVLQVGVSQVGAFSTIAIQPLLMLFENFIQFLFVHFVSSNPSSFAVKKKSELTFAVLSRQFASFKWGLVTSFTGKRTI